MHFALQLLIPFELVGACIFQAIAVSYCAPVLGSLPGCSPKMFESLTTVVRSYVILLLAPLGLSTPHIISSLCDKSKPLRFFNQLKLSLSFWPYSILVCLIIGICYAVVSVVNSDRLSLPDGSQWLLLVSCCLGLGLGVHAFDSLFRLVAERCAAFPEARQPPCSCCRRKKPPPLAPPPRKDGVEDVSLNARTKSGAPLAARMSFLRWFEVTVDPWYRPTPRQIRQGKRLPLSRVKCDLIMLVCLGTAMLAFVAFQFFTFYTNPQHTATLERIRVDSSYWSIALEASALRARTFPANLVIYGATAAAVAAAPACGLPGLSVSADPANEMVTLSFALGALATASDLRNCSIWVQPSAAAAAAGTLGGWWIGAQPTPGVRPLSTAEHRLLTTPPGAPLAMPPLAGPPGLRAAAPALHVVLGNVLVKPGFVPVVDVETVLRVPFPVGTLPSEISAHASNGSVLVFVDADGMGGAEVRSWKDVGGGLLDLIAKIGGIFPPLLGGFYVVIRVLQYVSENWLWVLATMSPPLVEPDEDEVERAAEEADSRKRAEIKDSVPFGDTSIVTKSGQQSVQLHTNPLARGVAVPPDMSMGNDTTTLSPYILGNAHPPRASV